MRRSAIMFVGLLAMGLVACQDGEGKESVGALLGAVGGGLAGAQVGKGDGQLAAVGVGAMLGAIIGGKVGRTLDEVDQHLMDENSTHALNELPANTTSTWRNPDSGHRGTFTPINTTQPRPGIYCREFQQTVTIGGETQEAYGTACRQPNGAWEIQQG